MIKLWGLRNKWKLWFVLSCKRCWKCTDWQPYVPSLPHGTSAQLSFRERMRNDQPYLLLAKWLCFALLALLTHFSLLKRNTCSDGAFKYEIQFSSLNCVFIKAVTITASRRPGWLSLAPISCVLLYEDGGVKHVREGRTVWMQWHIQAWSSRPAQGLNLPQRQPSL